MFVENLCWYSNVVLSELCLVKVVVDSSSIAVYWCVEWSIDRTNAPSAERLSEYIVWELSRCEGQHE